MTPQQLKKYLPPVLARRFDRFAEWWMNFPADNRDWDNFDNEFPEIPADGKK